MPRTEPAPCCRPLPPPTLAVRGGALLAAASALACGCAAPAASVVVRVEDVPSARAGDQPPSGQPGVSVWATPAAAAHPLDFAALLRSAEDSPRASVTDARGHASLTVPADRPFVITVWLPGYGPIGRTFDGAAEAMRFGAWGLVPTNPSASPPKWRAVVLSPDQIRTPGPAPRPTR